MSLLNRDRETMDQAGEVTRRSFLKLAGFSAGAIALAGCSREPAARAIPLLAGSEALTPGRARYYATLCPGCEAGCGALAKVLDGRPVKLEGNLEHPLSRGGLCAIGQAQVLSLYDSRRLVAPLEGKERSDWATVTGRVADELGRIRREGGAVRFLTRTVTSPTLRAEIGAFLAPFADARHVEMDAPSASATLEANELLYGAAVLPRYRFDRAREIVSFGADFLGTWHSPVEHTRAFGEARAIGEGLPFARLTQLEARYTLTGGKADRRIRLHPRETPAALADLANRVATRCGKERRVRVKGSSSLAPDVAENLAERLCTAPERTALVVSGENDRDVQLLVAWINHLLSADAEGGTVDVGAPSLQRRGRDREVAELAAEIRAGGVAALFVAGANPVYDLPGGEELAAAVAAVPLSVSFADRLDETAAATGIVAPARPAFVSWTDAEPVAGIVTVGQPVFRPAAGSRSLAECLAAFRSEPLSDRRIFEESWRTRIWPRRTGDEPFAGFFERAVQDGFVSVRPEPLSLRPFDESRVPREVAMPAGAAEGLAAVLHPTVAMGDGRHAENAWLQELPDPLTKVTWENVASFSAATAAALSIEDGDVVRIGAEDGATVELPAVVQPGQHDGVVAVALGYGREGTERFTSIGPDWIESEPTVREGERVGANASPLRSLAGDRLSDVRGPVTVTRTGRRRDLARTQVYDSQEVPEKIAPKDGGHRDAVRVLPLGAVRRGEAAAEPHEEPLPDLWDRGPRTGRPQWGMAVDLSACTGCAACVVACQAENNVPVVGRDEVRRNREMHWIRVDRYYERRGADADLVHQPMMCQQCGNAPCETVCPVLATVHSEDGLNQQVYNRCVGTRYCANNCPYKVRRFNWFDYARGDKVENLVLNPDVVVRSRGVMEKCSFCVQRIRDAKAVARREGRPLTGEDVTPACAQSCPAGAIVFGDRADAGGRLGKRKKDPRHYEVLAELGVEPAVSYLAHVRDREDSE